MPRHQPIEAPETQPLAPGFVPRGDEDDVARLLLRPCFPTDTEALILAGFDTLDRLLCLEQAQGGHDGRCRVPPRCWRALFDVRPSQVLMAHNHPSGIARPSDADRAATRDAAHLLRLVGIGLSDHLIFTPEGHFSFRNAGLL